MMQSVDGGVIIDHYAVLGLPSGEEGAKLSDYEINKAYRLMARTLHPDKRRGDPDAHTSFVKLHKLLKDAKTRKWFDQLLTIQRLKLLHRRRQQNITSSSGGVLDRSKILKVSWKTKININDVREADHYTAQRLREIFGIFGCVEEVVVKKKIALVLMASNKDAATAAATGVSGYPLLSVKLLQPAAA